MPRPRKRRIVRRQPQPVVYKPAGVALSELRPIHLLPEELEALRLADVERLTQVQAAQSMGVSRSTLQRILARARRRVAVALVEGQALQIEGATVDVVCPPQRHRRRRD